MPTNGLFSASAALRVQGSISISASTDVMTETSCCPFVRPADAQGVASAFCSNGQQWTGVAC